MRAMAKKKSSGHGGAREGAGAKPSVSSDGTEERVMVRLGSEHGQELDHLEAELKTTRAGAIRHLIEQSAARRARREGG